MAVYYLKSHTSVRIIYMLFAHRYCGSRAFLNSLEFNKKHTHKKNGQAANKKKKERKEGTHTMHIHLFQLAI